MLVVPALATGQTGIWERGRGFKIVALNAVMWLAVVHLDPTEALPVLDLLTARVVVAGRRSNRCVASSAPWLLLRPAISFPAGQ